mmetsp:Transcript_18182/g.56392  ORF Transcript_18182/g.56392 Transcript_18182/m.56392 type:complete len:311 (-) Transcript_18182:417-1349(-)
MGPNLLALGMARRGVGLAIACAVSTSVVASSSRSLACCNMRSCCSKKAVSTPRGAMRSPLLASREGPPRMRKRLVSPRRRERDEAGASRQPLPPRKLLLRCRRLASERSERSDWSPGRRRLPIRSKSSSPATAAAPSPPPSMIALRAVAGSGSGLRKNSSHEVADCGVGCGCGCAGSSACGVLPTAPPCAGVGCFAVLSRAASGAGVCAMPPPAPAPACDGVPCTLMSSGEWHSCCCWRCASHAACIAAGAGACTAIGGGCTAADAASTHCGCGENALASGGGGSAGGFSPTVDAEGIGVVAAAALPPAP